MSKFVETNFDNRKNILKFEPSVAMSVLVDDTGVSAVDGKKIVPAGTPVKGKTKTVLENPNEPVIKDDTATAEGILLYDVDVTHGKKEGAMLLFGFVDLTKMQTPPSAAAQKAMTMIKFMK
ncbi:MAG: hypothetical protein Q4A78_12240 [Peptostreptococcaceae bacterium]|nr:hypothetical protein [Peptostreptococcaceae bacterium]